MRDALQSVGWLASIVYSSIPLFWLMIHPFVTRWKERKRSPYRVLLPAWVAIWIVFAVLTWRWRHVELYSTPWSWLPAALFYRGDIYLLAGGSIFQLVAAGWLAGAFSVESNSAFSDNGHSSTRASSNLFGAFV